MTFLPSFSGFAYDPETGAISRLTKRGLKVVGYISDQGYVRFYAHGKLFYAHRVAWFLHHGEWPVEDIDHINGDRSDNRIVNLRAATRRENNQNMAINSRNKTGFLGVCELNGKFRAHICVDYRNRSLGVFETPQEAHRAYCEAKKNIHCFQPEVRDAAIREVAP